MKVVNARIQPNLDVSLITFGSFENILGNCVLVVNMITEKRAPNIAAINTLTPIVNFAPFGFPAPSSFETLTLVCGT